MQKLVMWVVENFGVVEMQIDSEESYMRNITWNYVKELKDVLSIKKSENVSEIKIQLLDS